MNYTRYNANPNNPFENISPDKYSIIKIKGYFREYTAYGLSISNEYVKSLNNLNEFKEYLSTIFKEIPPFVDFINFDKLKTEGTKETLQNLDKVIGDDYVMYDFSSDIHSLYSNRKIFGEANEKYRDNYYLVDTSSFYEEVPVGKINDFDKYIKDNYEIRTQKGMYKDCVEELKDCVEEWAKNCVESGLGYPEDYDEFVKICEDSLDIRRYRNYFDEETLEKEYQHFQDCVADEMEKAVDNMEDDIEGE